MTSSREPLPTDGSPRRRFAVVCPNFFPRTCGVGDYSVRLGAELARRDFPVAFFSRQPAQPHPIAPRLPIFGAQGARPVAIARHILREILAFRPSDVLLQYTSQMWEARRFGSPGVPNLARELRRSGARVTVIAHELFVPFARRPDLLAAALTQRAQMGYLLANCDRAFVTTETRTAHMAPYARLVGGPAPGVLRVGPSALPVPAVHDAPGPRLGVFSTAAVGKRFDVVLGCFEAIAAVFPAAELVIIGDLGAPDSRNVREITEAVRRHPARERVRVTGKLSLDEVAREIARLDVYLFPVDTGANTRSSALPTALGAGLPVVAFDGPETDHAVFRDGQNVSLVRALDGHAFAEASLRLLRNPEEAARIGAGARELYLQHLTWERIADHLLRNI